MCAQTIVVVGESHSVSKAKPFIAMDHSLQNGDFCSKSRPPTAWSARLGPPVRSTRREGTGRCRGWSALMTAPDRGPQRYGLATPGPRRASRRRQSEISQISARQATCPTAARPSSAACSATGP